MSNAVNLFVDQGADYYRTMTVIDIHNSPLDISNYTIKGQIRKNYTSTTNANFNMLILDAVNGKIGMGLNNTTTQSLSEIRYVYDIEITSPDNKVYRIMEGILTVNPCVTR